MATPSRDGGGRFYRAVWRWHFYAGLLTLPVIAWLALTGAVYLFPQAIDRLAHTELKVVEPIDGATRLAPSRLVEVALAHTPGTLMRYTTATSAVGSVEILVRDAGGSRHVVYVDPWRGRALGALPERGTAAWTVRRLHSLELLGPWANWLVEAAAGWAILLVLTGLWLWWPRRGLKAALMVRGSVGERRWWRSLHGVLGFGAGGVLLFLAVSGMPWSPIWGRQVNLWANGNDTGYPSGVRVDLPLSDRTMTDLGETAWTLQRARLPHSTARSEGGDPHAAHSDGGQVHGVGREAGADGRWPGMTGLDALIAELDRRGLAPGWSLQMPGTIDGVFTASVYPADLSRQRVIHVDAYRGAVLLDMGYDDYGPLGRGLEWVINIHLGQQFGRANQIVLLLGCLAIVALCVSGAAAWWLRRPRGSIGMPPAPAPATLRAVTAMLVAGGLLFPLTGLSMLLVWALDRLHFRRALGNA